MNRFLCFVMPLVVLSVLFAGLVVHAAQSDPDLHAYDTLTHTVGK